MNTSWDWHHKLDIYTTNDKTLQRDKLGLSWLSILLTFWQMRDHKNNILGKIEGFC